MRKNLKMLRVKHDLTQEEMAEKIGCDRGTYASIENGSRDGRLAFWQELQQAFEIPESDMWELIRNE